MALARSSYGRTATLLVLGVLLLTVCAAVYLAIPHLSPKGDLSPAELLQKRQQRVSTLITILLISGLLIVLFAFGAYVLIQVGRAVAREHVGGKPTEYVDAWQQYRVSDEQISAATEEDRPPGGSGGKRRGRRRPEAPDSGEAENDEPDAPDEPPHEGPDSGPRPPKRGPGDAPAED